MMYLDDKTIEDFVNELFEDSKRDWMKENYNGYLIWDEARLGWKRSKYGLSYDTKCTQTHIDYPH